MVKITPNSVSEPVAITIPLPRPFIICKRPEYWNRVLLHTIPYQSTHVNNTCPLRHGHRFTSNSTICIIAPLVGLLPGLCFACETALVDLQVNRVNDADVCRDAITSLKLDEIARDEFIGKDVKFLAITEVTSQ